MLQSDQATHEAQSKLAKSSYAKVRDQVGSCLIQSLTFDLDRLVFELHGLSQQEEQGIAVGLEVAAYSYADQRGHTQRKAKHLPRLFLAKSSREKEAPALSDRQLKEASLLGLAINQARHLVNLPPNDLQPQSYAQLVQSLFADSSTATVEVWSGQKLHDEKMNLLLAVGSGAAHAPCLVHIRYRPKAKADVQLQRPIALVGKGITFDSGGLDIKPSSGMRLMKKDMGGSAAVVAILKWAESVALAQPLDGYIALAENAIDSQAFRPSDVIQARSGLTIEIDNTDAEGRLVLADALDVAVTVTSEDRPSHVIDVATLTGAGKVALGTEIASLFSNHDELASALFQSGLATGDWMWRTPLFDGYRSQLKSNFADHVNSASSGFGGAITAALFLEFFTRDIPWAHLDIYAWKDAASGAWSEGGGSGQPVQALAHFLLNHSAQQSAASNS
jgi:leucyl aminopeptidase